MDWTGISLHCIHLTYPLMSSFYRSITASFSFSFSLSSFGVFGSTPRHLWREPHEGSSWLPRKRINDSFLCEQTDWLVAGGYIFGQGTAKKEPKEKKKTKNNCERATGEEGAQAGGVLLSPTVGHEMSMSCTTRVRSRLSIPKVATLYGSDGSDG